MLNKVLFCLIAAVGLAGSKPTSPCEIHVVRVPSSAIMCVGVADGYTVTTIDGWTVICSGGTRYRFESKGVAY